MTGWSPDWVVGLGGGSSIDTAKAAWFLYERPDVELEAINPAQEFGLRQKARLITIPTTAGSGAEATSAVVIKDTVHHRKMELACNELVADYAIIDPFFSARLPRRLTAETGIDVLAHAIEAYTSTWANDFSDGLCLQAARLAFDYLPCAVESGDRNVKAREKMANAATLAGMALCNSQIGLAHALGHSAGAAFGLPHGRVTGLFLPFTIEFTARESGARYLDLARFIGAPARTESDAGLVLARSLRSLMASTGLPLSLKEAGVARADLEGNLEALCENAFLDIGLVTHPRVPSENELKDLYLCAFDGSSVNF
jgi:alcohol dehydrogenase class IV